MKLSCWVCSILTAAMIVLSQSGCAVTRLANSENCDGYHDSERNVDIYVCQHPRPMREFGR